MSQLERIIEEICRGPFIRAHPLHRNLSTNSTYYVSILPYIHKVTCFYHANAICSIVMTFLRQTKGLLNNEIELKDYA